MPKVWGQGRVSLHSTRPPRLTFSCAIWLGVVAMLPFGAYGQGGTLDPTFDPGLGPNGEVDMIAVQPDGRILIAGDFTTYNGVVRSGLARLIGDGSLDMTFDAGTNLSGLEAVDPLPSGQILIGGWFENIQGSGIRSLARLNSDGSVDATFNANISGLVHKIKRLTDGRIMVSGSFSAVQGQPRINLVRLLGDGGVDPSFVAAQAHNLISAMDVLSDGRVLVGYRQEWWMPSYLVRLLANGEGDTTFNASSFSWDISSLTLASGGQIYVQSRSTVNGLLRLNANGSPDSSFSLGSWPASAATVNACAIQSNGGVILGGNIPRLYNQPIQNIIRLLPSGALDNSYALGLGADYFVDCMRLQADGKLLVGGTFSRFDGIPRARLARLNADGATSAGIFHFQSQSFTNSESDTVAMINVRRAAGSRGTVTVNYQTSDGSATAGIDYIPTAGTLTFAAGETLKAFPVQLIDNGLYQSNKTLLVTLHSPGGGAALSSETNATLVLTHDDSAIQFSGAVFRGNEAAAFATIQVVRVGVPKGDASVSYVTANGSGIAGIDYLSQTGTLLFMSNQTSAVFTVSLLDDPELEGEETVFLRLTNLVGMAHIGSPSVCTLIIHDNDGVGGVTTDLRPVQTNVVQAVATDSQGRIIFGGGYFYAPSVGLQRLLPDSGRDPDFMSSPVNVHEIVVTPQDAIYFLGHQYFWGTSNFVARQSASGRLEWEIRDRNTFSAVAVLPDERILIGGNFIDILGHPRKGLARLMPDGTLDLTFNPSGISNTVGEISVQRDGAFIFSTPKGFNWDNARRLVRMFPNGDRDMTFDVTMDYYVSAIAPLDDGSLIVGGAFGVVNGTSRPKLAKLRPNGSLDESFAATAAPDGDVYALAVQCDGSILVGGAFTNIFGHVSPGLARLLPDGSLDRTFDVGTGSGSRFQNSASQGPVLDVAVQSDGEIVVAGLFTSFNNVPAAGLIRLHGDGVAGASFFSFASRTFTASERSGSADIRVSRSGSVESQASVTVNAIRASGTSANSLHFSPGQAEATLSIPLADDCTGRGNEIIRLVLDGAPNGSCVVRDRAELHVHDDEMAGAPDISFCPVAPSPPAVNAILRMQNGQWLIAGGGTATQRGVVRLNADGGLDSQFQTMSDPFLAPFREVASIAPAPGGKWYIAGSFSRGSYWEAGGSNFLARINADGSWDHSFDAAISWSDRGIGSWPTGILAIAVQPDGRILAAGNTYLNQGQAAVGRLARFLPSGQFDTSFNRSAWAWGNETVRALALLPTGKIIVGGGFVTYGAVARTNLARLHADGTVDSTFLPYFPKAVFCVAVEPSGGLLVGGANLVKRLLPNGASGPGFPTQVDAVVRACAVLPDGGSLIGGSFSQVNNQARRSVARLLADGSVDPTFDCGSGADAAVTSLVPLPDGRLMVGGWFSQINGAPARGIALLSSGGAPILSAPVLNQNGTVTLLGQVQPGCPHVLERSSGLITWETVTHTLPNASPWIFTDEAPEGSPWFYRVRREHSAP
jgi:uncharacterized delta-60 repeat protein